MGTHFIQNLSIVVDTPCFVPTQDMIIDCVEYDFRYRSSLRGYRLLFLVLAYLDQIGSFESNQYLRFPLDDGKDYRVSGISGQGAQQGIRMGTDL